MARFGLKASSVFWVFTAAFDSFWLPFVYFGFYYRLPATVHASSDRGVLHLNDWICNNERIVDGIFVIDRPFCFSFNFQIINIRELDDRGLLVVFWSFWIQICEPRWFVPFFFFLITRE